jgi:hypothetical protein
MTALQAQPTPPADDRFLALCARLWDQPRRGAKGRDETFGLRSVYDGICQSFRLLNEAVFMRSAKDARAALFNLREGRPSETLCRPMLARLHKR